MSQHGKVLLLDTSAIDEQMVAVLKALSSEWRLRILEQLGTETRSVNQLATALGIPTMTASMHVKALEEAGLIMTQLAPARRGVQKLCSRTYEQIVISLPPLERKSAQAVEVAMPIGSYVDFQATPSCGLATASAIVGMIDDPASFLEPSRLHAQILWLTTGYVEYRFPSRLPAGMRPTGLQIRMEICSEARMYAEDHPSDITVWVNGREIGTWTCPGDYGGSRGALTPAWWLDADSQFGLHKRWEVSGAGSFIDGVQISGLTLDDLRIGSSAAISVRIGVKPEARHPNGINLFGRMFGNYPEDLVLRISYEDQPEGGRRDSTR